MDQRLVRNVALLVDSDFDDYVALKTPRQTGCVDLRLRSHDRQGGLNFESRRRSFPERAIGGAGTGGLWIGTRDCASRCYILARISSLLDTIRMRTEAPFVILEQRSPKRLNLLLSSGSI